MQMVKLDLLILDESVVNYTSGTLTLSYDPDSMEGDAGEGDQLRVTTVWVTVWVMVFPSPRSLVKDRRPGLNLGKLQRSHLQRSH